MQDKRIFTVEQMLENHYRVAAARLDIDAYFGPDQVAYPRWYTTDQRFADLRERSILSADDEALFRHLMTAGA